MPANVPFDYARNRALGLRGQASESALWARARQASQSERARAAYMPGSLSDMAPPDFGKEEFSRPLSGAVVSVKDLLDVQGQVTAAGSLVLAGQAPARRHAAAVQRLVDAGARLLGRSHMVEFAYSGVGVNPHFAPVFAVDVCFAPSGHAYRTLAQNHVPGGSSSGAAVTVATGAAHIGLGSDTGGSLRIPAAFNGLVGFKSTAALVPTQGAIPLSTTLDTIGAITRTVEDAILAHEALADRTVIRSAVPLPGWRLAVPTNYFLDGCDAVTREAFERTLDALRQQGARVEPLALAHLDELAQWSAYGSFAAAESYAWHCDLLQHHAHKYDPRVLSRIRSGAKMSARDYLKLQDLQRDWIRRLSRVIEGYDALLSPTVAITAPLHATVAPGAERDEIFARLNALILRNTSAINLLNGCAISVPCHLAHEPPVGLMLWNSAFKDDAILNVAKCVEAALAQRLTQ